MTAATPANAARVAAAALEQTHRVRSALLTVSSVLTQHQLAVVAVTVEAGPLTADGVPRATVTVHPGGFIRWCEVLRSTQVRIQRNRALVASTDPAHMSGLRWHVTTHIPRATTMRVRDDLPGPSEVPWRGDHARISRMRLETALTLRGLMGGVQS